MATHLQHRERLRRTYTASGAQIQERFHVEKSGRKGHQEETGNQGTWGSCLWTCSKDCGMRETGMDALPEGKIYHMQDQ